MTAYVSKTYKIDMADTRAHAAVAAAIQTGRLVRPTELACIDCGKPAIVYDHYLGYAREHWLDVEPVCVSCNALRAWQKPDVSPGVVSAVLIRLPTWLVEELDADARASGRSRNAHVTWLLQRAYPAAAAKHPERHIRPQGPRMREESIAYDA